MTFSDILDALTPEIQQAATDAELQRRGAGLIYISRTLGVWSGKRQQI
jgi:hypothetical protein